MILHGVIVSVFAFVVAARVVVIAQSVVVVVDAFSLAS